MQQRRAYSGQGARVGGVAAATGSAFASNSLGRSTKSMRFPRLLANGPDAASLFEAEGMDIGVCSQQGKRPYQEDEYSIKPYLKSRGDGNSDTHFFGLFDGHAGGRCSKYISSTFADALAEDPSFHTNIPQALKKTFGATNELFLQIAERSKLHDGSTGICCVVRDGRLFVANVGDCRTLIISGGKAIQMSVDQKPTSPEEQRRIASFGGTVVYCMGTARVNGVLAVSRAFGNRTLRSVIRPDPEFSLRDLTADDQYLVMASDGLWDVLRNVDVSQICNSFASQGSQHIAEELVHCALAKGSQDNVTCIVVRFSTSITCPHKKQPAQANNNSNNNVQNNSQHQSGQQQKYFANTTGSVNNGKSIGEMFAALSTNGQASSSSGNSSLFPTNSGASSSNANYDRNANSSHNNNRGGNLAAGAGYSSAAANNYNNNYSQNYNSSMNSNHSQSANTGLNANNSLSEDYYGNSAQQKSASNRSHPHSAKNTTGMRRNDGTNQHTLMDVKASNSNSIQTGKLFHNPSYKVQGNTSQSSGGGSLFPAAYGHNNSQIKRPNSVSGSVRIGMPMLYTNSSSHGANANNTNNVNLGDNHQSPAVGNLMSEEGGQSLNEGNGSFFVSNGTTRMSSAQGQSRSSAQPMHYGNLPANLTGNSKGGMQVSRGSSYGSAQFDNGHGQGQVSGQHGSMLTRGGNYSNHSGYK